MASPTTATAQLTTQIIGASNELAELATLESWQLQEGYYNGVAFHVMLPNYNITNPASDLTNYFSGNNTIPLGTDAGVFHLIDQINKKLTVYQIPNRNSNIIEDYGIENTSISMLGIIAGTQSMAVLENLLGVFLDIPEDDTQPTDTQLGKKSGDKFRVLVHPIFGTIPQAFLQKVQILHTSQRWQSVSFELQFLVANPTYLVANQKTIDWRTSTQNALNIAQVTATEILQAFSLVTGLTTHSYPYQSPLVGIEVGQSTPLIDTQGSYLSTTEKNIENKLTSLNTIFTNSIAFLVQFSGGEIVNSYYNSITIDFSVLPVYTPQSQKFTYTDAQNLLTNYTTQLDDFISLSSVNNYDFYIQSNLEALRRSVVLLDDISKQILLKNNLLKEIITDKNLSLYEIIFQNKANIDNFDLIGELNTGVFFDALSIPPGTKLTLIL